MSVSLLLLIVAVVAIVWIARGRRQAPPPPVDDQAPPQATDWGRPPPPQAQQPGMGGQVMGGLATGMALGAGALAAQEIGRHMLGGEQSHHGLADAGDLPHNAGSASHSSLADDAGLGTVGREDSASWDDGGSLGGDDGGGWDA